ncbi:MAG: hypothetical protein K0Q66_1430 [Chitinophagaceae bacterium]|jgi:hypothetical protein|nr:hypothetical protein [Chitinophagaceae bacterium]
MRIWSLHPSYLDAKGLVALWRETLLAKHVLEGKTKGYTNHPQLNRFKASKFPVDAINHYLQFIHKEAEARGYNFDRSKINWECKKQKLKVTKGQIDYELQHLTKKLAQRDQTKLEDISKLKEHAPHPMFNIVAGDIEAWEII